MHPSQSSSFQNQQRQAVLNGGMRFSNVMPQGMPSNDPPTPAYSPTDQGALNEGLYTFNANANPYINNQYQSVPYQSVPYQSATYQSATYQSAPYQSPPIGIYFPSMFCFL